MSKLNLDGRPTRPDVDLLLKSFEFNEGDIVRHDQIEPVIEEDWRSNRYRTVMEALRKRIKQDRNVAVIAVTNVGFKVISANDWVDVNASKTRLNFERERRNFRDTGRIPNHELSPEQRVRKDALQRTQLALMKAGKEIKELPPPPKPVAPVTHLSTKRLGHK